MPTIQQIIDKIDLKYPNGSQPAQKVDIMQTLQNRIFRKYRIPTSEEFTLIANTYSLVTGINPTMIYDVLVDGISYPERKLIGHSLDHQTYHTFIENFMIIHPTPTIDVNVTVYHYSMPPALSISNLSAKPSLDEDYHDMLVYGVCKELAENDQRYDVASGFSIQYNELESELAEVFKVLPEVKTILVESGW